MKKLLIVLAIVLLAIPACADWSVTVTWDAPNVPVEGYHLWESSNRGGLYTLRADEIDGAETQYRFLIEIEPGQSRYFVMTAFDAGRESDYSNEVNYNHPFPVGAIPAPQNVRLVADVL